ncbi:hypothetical protein Q7P37_010274 [Cladosporium fusiforme]
MRLQCTKRISLGSERMHVNASLSASLTSVSAHVHHPASLRRLISRQCFVYAPFAWVGHVWDGLCEASMLCIRAFGAPGIPQFLQSTPPPNFNTMATIQDFSGLQYIRSAEGTVEAQAYKNNNYQYASSSHALDHDMNPALILQPRSDADIVAAVKYAKDNNIAVAIKSGGHQYSGASSTSGSNILLDLKATFKDLNNDLKVLDQATDKSFIYVSVSFSLGELNGFLAKNGLFLPHGQCADVRVGGHAQTGGYGQLGRSFGLFGDHVREIRFVDHNAEIKTIDASSDAELFNAILGGSPGNFGVITHYTVEVHRDTNHDFKSVGGQGPHCLRAVWWYNQATVTALLAKVAEMADNPDWPRNYDLCVSVLSSDFKLLDLVPEMDGVMKRDHPEIYGLDGMPSWPPTVIVYAQWVPLSKDDKYDPKWFDALNNAGKWRLLSQTFDQPMSKMTGEWIFRQPREFDHPYEKRTYMTNSTTLTKDNWATAASNQIHKVLHTDLTSDLWMNCWLSVQIQCFGGKFSKFHTNASNGTAYSWRDSTVCQVMDCFHESKYKTTADKWQAENDKLFVGPSSCFSKPDKRVLWGSYGDWDLHKMRSTYYEDEKKYQLLQKVRARADPQGTFSPNPFAVKRAS